MRKNNRPPSSHASGPSGTRLAAIASSPSLTEQDALVALLNAGRLSEGETMARDFTQRYPKAAFGWKALGTVLLAGDRQREALPALQQALKLHPGDSECLNSLGKTLQGLGQLAAAMEAIERALSLRPDYVSALINRGNVLVQLGRADEALASLDRALSVQPDSASAHNDRGHALKALGRLDAALAAYTRAIELKPDFAEAHHNLGSVLRELDLGVWRALVVQSTHGPAPAGQTAIDLHDRLAARQRFQLTRTEQPLEPAALIDDRPALDDDDTGERGRLKTKTLSHLQSQTGCKPVCVGGSCSLIRQGR